MPEIRNGNPNEVLNESGEASANSSEMQEQPEDIELMEQSRSLVEISSLAEFETIPAVAEGKRTATEKFQAEGASDEALEYWMEKKFNRRLSNLIERAREGNKKVFVTDFGEGPWAVVASSPEEITALEERLKGLSSLMAKIEPNRTWGFCGWAADLADRLGHADGDIDVSSPGAGVETKYPSYDEAEAKAVSYMTSHTFNYVDVSESGKTLYFDLTAQAYMFSLGGRSCKESWLKGLAIVEDIGQQEVTEMLYQNDTLTRASFNVSGQAEDKLKEHIIWDKQNLFTNSALEAEGLSRADK